jgi:hypothetical protein
MNLGNLLGMALTLIPKQPFSYYAFIERKLQPNGLDLAIYAQPQTLTGSVQPIPRSLYQQYGLDFDKYYLTFYVSKSIIDVARNVSGDAMAYNGNYYQCESKTDWFPQDGWVAVLAVQVPSIAGIC